MNIAKVLFTGIILLTAAVTYAAPIDNVTSSAFMPGDSAVFNLDFVDPFGLPVFDVMINARYVDIPETRVIPMTHADPDPHYLMTYVGSAIFDTPAATIEYFGEDRGLARRERGHGAGSPDLARDSDHLRRWL